MEPPTASTHERRRRGDRRRQRIPVAVERRGGQDRRLVRANLSEAERAVHDEQEFGDAMQTFCRTVPYPTCLDVLQVAHSLGYRRTP